MTACADYEVWIEIRLHGALAPEQSRELDAHLEGCASCQRFAGLARGTEESMRTAAHAFEAQVDWERIRGHVRATSRRNRLEHWIAAGFCLALLITLAVLRLPLRSTVIETLAIAAVAWALFRELRKIARGVRAAERSDAAALDWMRADLDRRLAGRRQVLIAHVCLSAGIAIALLFDVLTVHGVGRVPILLVLLISIADAVYGQLVELPRLQRERAELGG